MNKNSYDELLKHISNRYYLAIVVGKKYRDIIADNLKDNTFYNSNQITDKIFKEIINGEINIGGL